MKAVISILMIAGYGLLFTSLLVGCKTQPYTPSYAGKIIPVLSKELNHYWVPETKASYSNATGCFKVQMTIDSNGRVIDPTFVKMIGPSSPQSWLLNYLSGLQYTPAPTNPNRIPVQTTGQWALFSGEMDTQQHAIKVLNNARACFDALDRATN